MNKSRFRRRGLPAAIAVVAASAAVATTVWLGGNADAGTTSDAALNAAVAKQIRSAHARTADMTKSFRKNLKANGISPAQAADGLNFGDITGDGVADLGAVDKTGVLWIYPGSGYSYPGTGPRSKRLFNARLRVGGGWNAFTTIVRHGDFNGDGKQDVVTRNAAGALFFYAGTGTTPTLFKKGVKVGRGGWQTFRSIVGVGDLNSDGKDDLIAQKINGDLLLYRGTGNGTNLFAISQTRIGTGFRGNLLTAIGDLTGDGRTELLYRDATNRVWAYFSKPGTLPIGIRVPYTDNPAEGKAFKNLVGVGNLTTDAGLEPTPDILQQVDNSLFIDALDMETSDDDEFVVGSGWGPYKLF